MPSKEEVKKWAEYVEKSEGNSILLPDLFKEQATQIEKLRAEFNEVVKALSKKEITLAKLQQDMFFDLRSYLEEQGDKAIWQKDVGFETGALNEGVYVVNVSLPQPRR